MVGNKDLERTCHITITGDLGSGKSSVAKKISTLLDFEYISTGVIQRQIAQSKGLNTLELNIISDDNPEIDNYIDNKIKEINKAKSPFILDSRLAWHFIDESFKVYLIALPEVAANRVLLDKNRTSEPFADNLESKIKDLSERRHLENTRFKSIYGIECDKFKNYDLIVDSTTASINQITELIVSEYHKWVINNYVFNKIWLSPLRIFPTLSIRELHKDNIDYLIENIKLNGFDINEPLELLQVEKDYYIWDGHHRLSASISNHINLIPVKIKAKDIQEIIPKMIAENYIKTTVTFSMIYDWEDMHKFHYYHYPKFLLQNE